MTSADAGVRRRLFLAREAAKLTQKDAAVDLGVTRQKLSRWENGSSSPSLEEFRGICALYGVTPSYILFGTMGLVPAVERAMCSAAAATSAGT